MTFYDIKNKKQLLNVKRKIQKQQRDEKIDDANMYQDVAKFYKPLTEPLKEIAKSSKANQSLLELKDNSTNQSNIPAIEYQPQNVLAIEPEQSSSLNLGNISSNYLKKGFDRTYDYAYGIHPIDNSTRFKLGRNELIIDGNDITVANGSTYKGTEGLWRLLTLKEPGMTTENDKDNYKKLIIETRAFYRDDVDRIKPSRGSKFKNYIQPIYKSFMREGVSEALTPIRNTRSRQSFSGSPKEVTGQGVIFLPSEPNKLLERHRLLTLEMKAGNANVFNEIQAVNDALLDVGIFDSSDIENYYNFFFKK